MVMAHRPLKDYKVCIAIDIGSTGSGYAYSLVSDFRINQTNITVNDTWTVDGKRSLQYKTPTCLLLNPQKQFHAFGSTAEEQYAALAADDRHHDWFYFERFKMKTFQGEIKQNMDVEDAMGKAVPAMLVFSQSIRFIKEHAVNRINTSECRIQDKEIQWVITIPAIWDSKAKDFMKLAANKAGIKNLIIALEPDAASVYSLFTTPEPGQYTLDSQPVGSKYMVVDVGGGTTDVSIHQRVSNIQIKEAYPPNGGPWGGVGIDDAFISFVIDLLGEGVMDRFRVQACTDFIQWMKEFESLKQNVQTAEDGKPTQNDNKKKISISIPEKLNKIYKLLNDKTIAELTNQKNFKHKSTVTVTDGKLYFNIKIVLDMFKSVTDKIVSHLEALLKIKEIEDITLLIFVGGTSDSPLLQRTMSDKFQNSQRHVFYPKDCGTALLKGAVILGHIANITDDRFIRRTYGCGRKVEFNEKKHPERLKIVSCGKTWCRGVFNPVILAGTPVKEGTVIQKEIEALNYVDSVFALYVTDSKREIVYITDDDCEQVCKVHLNEVLPAKSKKKQVYTVKYIFGDDNLIVELTLKETGKIYRIVCEAEYNKF